MKPNDPLKGQALRHFKDQKTETVILWLQHVSTFHYSAFGLDSEDKIIHLPTSHNFLQFWPCYYSFLMLACHRILGLTSSLCKRHIPTNISSRLILSRLSYTLIFLILYHTVITLGLSAYICLCSALKWK